MIVLYDQFETEFKSVGIGTLDECKKCIVKEGLNDEFELEMDYPITGRHFKDLMVKNIICANTNPLNKERQAFRIYSITRPINGIITINAAHISYDMAGYVVEPFSATNLNDALTKIQNGDADSKFKFDTDILSDLTMETKKPYKMRSLLAGGSGTLLDIYGGEYEFDNYNVHLRKNRGKHTGIEIKYGKNMTDVTFETNSSNMYTDVYPYYCSESYEVKSVLENIFEHVYIVKGAETYSKGWLSFDDGGKAFEPKETGIAVQIFTEGDFYKRKYQWDGEKYVENPLAIPNIASTIKQNIKKENFVVLPEKFIKTQCSSDAKQVLLLDLTNEFSEVPSEDKLRAKANEYIEENNIGKATESIDVTFTNLCDCEEYKFLKKAETILLGDYINLLYKDLGLSVEKQVIKIEFDCITETYNKIQLGTKSTSLVERSMSVGDSISSLSNDKGYTDKYTVDSLIAKKVTADYVEALEIEVNSAKIKGLLTASQINCDGVIHSASAEIDKIVAKSFTADNAEIKKVLEAGEIHVKGSIDATSGNIGGVSIENGVLHCDKIIQNGETEIRNYVKTTEINADYIKSGTISACQINITNEKGENQFTVDSYGNLTSKSGTIGGLTINGENGLSFGNNFMIGMININPQTDVAVPGIQTTLLFANTYMTTSFENLNYYQTLYDGANLDIEEYTESDRALNRTVRYSIHDIEKIPVIDTYKASNERTLNKVVLPNKIYVGVVSVNPTSAKSFDCKGFGFTKVFAVMATVNNNNTAYKTARCASTYINGTTIYISTSSNNTEDVTYTIYGC